jgi:ABC-type nitrate/sulfonate/bicarbonate transport system substrate-binding protein
MRVYGNGVLVSSRLIAENPKAVAGFVRAFNRAFREMLADPESGVKALKAREPLTDEKLELGRIALLMPATLTERTRLDGLGAIDKRILERQVDDVASAFTLKSMPNADLIFNSSFLPPKSERMPLK